MIKEGTVYEYSNNRGVKVPIDFSKIDKPYGIILINVYDQNDNIVKINNKFIYKHEMGIHIWNVSDFRNISSEIDTIPDMMDYLEIKNDMMSHDLLSPSVEELNFLALYKTNPEIVNEAMSLKSKLTITPGIWDSYRQDLSENIKKTK